MSMPRFLLLLAACSLATFSILAADRAAGQAFQANYDEEKVPDYELPDPLLGPDGQRVSSPQAWPAQREHWMQLLADHVYGHAPDLPYEMEVTEFESGEGLGGKARRRQLRVELSTDAGSLPIEVLVYLPADAEPRGLFLGLNFHGNHTVSDDPEIPLPSSWVRNSGDTGATDNQPSEEGRGTSQRRWPIELIVGRGYAVATVYCGDIDPDFHDGFENGVHGLFPQWQASEEHPHRWGTIAGWAWGLSRVLDALQQQSDLQDVPPIVIGHSRLGKTSLWAGATDPRFAGVISNNSGCGGAALSRRAFGETVGRINTSFPHWFCPQFHQYNEREDQLPVDQHILLAMAAPRALYVASASGDQWADPKGEFLATLHASSVYRLLGQEGLPTEEMIEPGGAIGSRVRYHLREGGHDIIAWDWEHYLDFADQEVAPSP
jgi:hypothetical protein